jgi:hypothetical protein
MNSGDAAKLFATSESEQGGVGALSGDDAFDVAALIRQPVRDFWRAG